MKYNELWSSKASRVLPHRPESGDLDVTLDDTKFGEGIQAACFSSQEHCTTRTRMVHDNASCMFGLHGTRPND